MAQTESVYGIHAVRNLLQSRPQDVKQLFLQRGRHDKKLDDIIALADAAALPVQWIDRKKLDAKTSGNHQGVLAEAIVNDAQMQEAELYHLAEQAETLTLVILDGVTDPHNLGACLRTADAAGVDALVVPKDRSAKLNATVRKVACGAAESVPMVRVTNLARCLHNLKQYGVWLVGTAGESTSNLYDHQFAKKTAVVMGAEGAGLRRLTREACDELVYIPMSGRVSSLNVSVATGICLFERVRQSR